LKQDLKQAKTRRWTMQKNGSIRKRSEKVVCGLPLYDFALGPDLQNGELRGHAHGIIAIGDIATGWLALGGMARGFVALGGFAVGCLSFGGCAIGLLSVGGAALGAVALGGGAFGVVAMGGAAVGYYAAGGAAWGKYAASAIERNPEAIEFFKTWFRWVLRK
jgi:hypothetical protein